METQPPKSKKYLIVPQKIFLYQKNDEKLQLKQNDLIYRNTKITILIGVLAIIAQIAEVITTIIFK